MNQNNSPFLLIKQLEANVLRLLSQMDISDLSYQEQNVVDQLRHALSDCRLEIQDYEQAETRQDQLEHAKQAQQYLKSVQKILSSNALYVFGPVDVAHLVAQIGQISDKVE